MGDSERIGRFKLLGRLGSGGMGIVYRARDEKLERDVALKVIHDEFVLDRQFRARLLREAKAAAAVTHPGVATVYEIGEDGEKLFIVMELLDGEPLRSSMGALPLKRALTIAAEIAEALARAHDAGIVHRDMKPENVLVTRDERVKVLDFGIARIEHAAESDDTQLSREGAVIGTPGYMSPEQALGKEVSASSDVFSLGVMLYEMLANRRPFGGKSLMEAAVSVTRDDPTPLAELTQLPVEVGALVHRCLAKDPAARPSSASLARSLRRLAEDVSVGTGANTEIASSGQVTLPKTPPAAQRSGGRGLLAILFVAAAGAGIAMGVREARRPVSGSPSSAASVEPATARAITDLPISETVETDARANYQNALADLRRADWYRAYEHLQEAVKKDPEFVLANLRLAHIEGVFGEVENARKRLRWVRERESRLDERNRAWLRGVEVLQMHEPVDYGEAARLFEDAARRWPKDAELKFMVAATRQRAQNPDKALEAARAAVALDPEYADALQTLARLSLRRGDTRGASEYLDRCVTARSIDCLHDRLDMNAHVGQCERVIADAKLLESSGATRSTQWVYTASALLSQHEPVEAAMPFLERAEKNADTARMRWEVNIARARVLALRGGFRELEKSLEGLYPDATSTEFLAAVTTLGLEAHQETSSEEEAVKSAERFLAKRHSAVGGYAGVPTQDPSPLFWSVLASAGRMSAGERDGKIAEWQKRERTLGFDAGTIWFQSEAVVARTPAEAKAALASRPKGFEPMQVQPDVLGWDVIGRLYRLNGEYVLARDMLTRATSSCMLLFFPVATLRAWAELGETYESLKDSKQACQAYQQVLHWWGKAEPRSITANRVRARVRALGC